MTDHTTAEQKAREMLERIGVDDASSFSAGAVVELANLIDALEQTRDELSDAHESLDIAYAKGREEGRACIPASVPKSCKWALTDEDMWESDCGAAWTFIDGGPTENGMRFCLACGRVLEVVAPKPENPDD